MAAAEQSEGEEFNYRCDVCTAVYPTALAAAQHVVNESTGKHGQRGEVPVWPSKTKEEADAPTAKDVADRKVFQEFGDDDLYGTIVEEFGEDSLPAMLDEHDARNLEILELAPKIFKDLDVILEDVERAVDTMDAFIRHYNEVNIAQPKEAESDDEEDSEQEEEAELGGRFTTGDVKERERQEVMNVLQRGGFLDSLNDVGYQVFRFVYDQRDDSDNVEVSEVAQRLGIPVSNTEETLDGLVDLGVIEHEPSDDTYYYIY